MKSTIKLYGIKRNRELIFIETLKELRFRINIKDDSPYNLVRKGALLRLLVIDGSKLYLTINRDYSLKFIRKLSSTIHQSHSISTFEEPNGSFSKVTYILDPNGEDCSISKFLKLPVIKINNPQLREYLKMNHISEEYDISSIIKLVANVHGGVHFENWGDKISSFIATDPSSPFNLNTNSALHGVIDNIGVIILDYFDVLGTKVFNNIRFTKPLAHEHTSSFKRLSKEESEGEG